MSSTVLELPIQAHTIKIPEWYDLSNAQAFVILRPRTNTPLSTHTWHHHYADFIGKYPPVTEDRDEEILDFYRRDRYDH